jgi:cobalt-zinc-cadmium efflux system membrane fusion protein
MNKLKHILSLVTAASILFACNNEQVLVEKESSLIEITDQQFTTDKMEMGEVETMAFESTVKCNGTIVPLPNGMAKVSAPVNGIIKSINCHDGQSVEKNQLLIEITGNEIIDLQKEFAEASANYYRLKNEYERVKSLYEEKVTSEKEFIVAKSDFISSKAMYNGLKLKVEEIGFSVSKIENGEFYSSYSIKSPIKGQISNIKANIGNYIDSQTELFDIINPNMFQIKLSVFASDISNLKIGQTVRFRSLNSNDFQLASISSIGVVVENDTKSIECYAKLKSNQQANPLANEFVESLVITNISETDALPTDAIIKTETGFVVLVLEKKENDNYYFNQVPVSIGKQQNGYSEIVGNKISGMVLTRGVYNINVD